MAAGRFFIKEGRRNDYPVYRQVWTRAVVALLAAALLPLVAIGGGVAAYTFRIIESETLDALRQEVRRHQQSIDNFLEERQRGLALVAATHTLPDLTSPGKIDFILQTLQEQMPGFTDLGVIDMAGRHLAYAGPHALAEVNYSDEAWFTALSDRDACISDVYLGFRNSPHFIIAVKQGRGENAFILRGTMDSDIFRSVVAAGMADVSAEAFIVNREGLLQTEDRSTRALLTPSGITPDPAAEAVTLISLGDSLVLTLWQEKVPWLSVIRVQQKEVYAGIRRARAAAVVTFILGSILIAATVLFTTGSLVRRLEAKGRRLGFLYSQLRRTSHQSASLELARGFFEEIKDIFANIDLSAKYLSDLRPTGDIPDLKTPLAQIAGEASRGHGLIDRFSGFVRDEDPVVSDVQVNALLDDLAAFLHRELARRGIEVVRDYQEALPPVRSDRGKLRQVLQNLFLNAVAALENGGRLHLKTRSHGGHITVVVGDNGPGIPPGDLERIFEPLYTTHPRSAGLGLPICRTILHQLGGSISVGSGARGGSEFTVRLPDRMR
jgi:two-component system NtrC family sensor kinase